MALDRPPALMRQTLACPACGGGEVLRVRTVREWSLGLEDMAVVRSEDGQLVCGTFELYACPGCGHVEWMAQGLDALKEDRAAGLSRTAAPAPCSGCGERVCWTVSTMREVGGGFLDPIPMGLRPRFQYGSIVIDDPVGRLATEICVKCGLTGWQVRGLADESLGELVEAPCPSCPGTRALLISPLHDMANWSQRGQPRRVAFQRHWLLGRTGRGHFDGLVCQGCSRLQWRACGLEEIGDDPQSGVQRLMRPDPSTSGGPYR